MEKSPEAFRTISEVADWLGVPTHVLRFWESRFSQVKPVKRAGGRRYYRPADMLLLGGIKRLLHDDGMTIRGVQKLLREEGVRHIMTFSQPLEGSYPMKDISPDEDMPEVEEVPPSPMAEDVEPEPIDNVVPLEPVSSAPERVGAEQDEPLDLIDEAATEAVEQRPEPDSDTDTKQVRDAPAPDDALQDEPLDLVDEAATPAAEPPAETGDEADGKTDEDAPEFAFLRRPEAGRTADAKPMEPAGPDDAEEAAPVAEAPGLFSSRRAAPAAAPAETPPVSAQPASPPAPSIPATPDVPETDLADDDADVPARPGLAARLMREPLRPDRLDAAVIARAASDLRTIRARL